MGRHSPRYLCTPHAAFPDECAPHPAGEPAWTLVVECAVCFSVVGVGLVLEASFVDPHGAGALAAFGGSGWFAAKVAATCAWLLLLVAYGMHELLGGGDAARAGSAASFPTAQPTRAPTPVPAPGANVGAGASPHHWSRSAAPLLRPFFLLEAHPTLRRHCPSHTFSRGALSHIGGAQSGGAQTRTGTR